MTTGQTSAIYTGQLSIDFYDLQNRDLVWRGVASKTTTQTRSPRSNRRTLQNRWRNF